MRLRKQIQIGPNIYFNNGHYAFRSSRYYLRHKTAPCKPLHGAIQRNRSHTSILHEGSSAYLVGIVYKAL